MRQIFALSLTLLVAFCAMPDAMPPDSGWQPDDVNAANLMMMAVHPSDLVHGRGSDTLPGSLKTDPTLRLLRGHAKPLPPSELADPGSASAAPPQGNGAQDDGGS